MITSVQYYHLCSLFAHLSREGLEFEKDFVIFYHFSFQVFPSSSRLMQQSCMCTHLGLSRTGTLMTSTASPSWLTLIHGQ